MSCSEEREMKRRLQMQLPVIDHVRSIYIVCAQCVPSIRTAPQGWNRTRRIETGAWHKGRCTIALVDIRLVHLKQDFMHGFKIASANFWLVALLREVLISVKKIDCKAPCCEAIHYFPITRCCIYTYLGA